MCRWGGEEFVILLTDTDYPTALMVAQRACTRLKDSPLIYDQQRLRITTSIGVATRQSHLELSALIDDADKALYQAKKQGKDQVRCYRPESAH